VILSYVKCFSQDQKALEDKTKESSGMQDLYDNLREEVNKCTEALANAERRYEAISTGKFMTEVKNKSSNNITRRFTNWK
jgi:hypothetical protein